MEKKRELNIRMGDGNYTLDVLNSFSAIDLDEFCITYNAELDLNDGRIVGGRMNERQGED